MLEIPEEWRRTAKEILERKGIVFVLGGVDSGKTTFSLFLVGEGVKKGLKVGLVDSDVGQSTIGPPTTIGLKLFENPPKLENLEPSALFFVGETSPRGHFLEILTGTKRLIEKSLSLGSDLTVVDSCGLVSSPVGTSLKFQKINLISPQFIVAFQRNKDLENILRAISSYSFKIFLLEVAPQTRLIPREERVLIRENAYKKYFSKSNQIEIPWTKVSIYPPEIDLSGKLDLVYLLVGLQNNFSECLGVGVISQIIPEKKTLRMITPVRDVKKVKGIILGYLKVSPQGKELGRISFQAR